MYKYFSSREVDSGSAAFSLGKNGKTTTNLYFIKNNEKIRGRDLQFFVPNITAVNYFQK